MALYINGTGEDSFGINGIDIDNLYVDGVLVFSSAANDFLMTLTSTLEPVFLAEGGTLTTTDNGDGTWDVSGSGVTRVYPDINDDNLSITEATVKLTDSLTSMNSMFYDNISIGNNSCENIITINFLPTVNTINVTSLEKICYRCRFLVNLDVSNIDTTNVTIFRDLCSYASSLSNLTIPNDFVKSGTVDINQIFLGTSIQSIDVSGWDTSSLVNMYNIFGSTQIIELDVSSWDVSNVTVMSGIFANMTNLVSLNVSGWTTPLLTSMDLVFQAIKVQSLDLSSWDTSNVTSMTQLFRNCEDLICITNLDTRNVDWSTLPSGIFDNNPSLIAPDEATVALLEGGGGLDWVNSNACPSEAPIYLLTESLVTGSYALQTYWYVVNSSASGSIYNGRLEHIGDGTKAEGAPWEPGTDQYDQLGWIDLSIQGDGFGSRKIMTGWIPSSVREWDIFGTYNLVLNTSYDAYVLHYKGNGLIDIYLGDNTTDFSTMSEPTYADVPYTPDGTEWVITENAPNIINVQNLLYNMNSFITI